MVNGTQIFHLRNDQPVTITVEQNHPKVVITDGYHLTKPVELVYHHLDTYYFKVICAISDEQLLAGGLLLIVLYLVGFFTGVFALKLLSFAPIIWILIQYYLMRKDFIQITPV